MATVPLFDRLDYPCVPTMRPERQGHGRRSRMAGGHRIVALSVLEGWASTSDAASLRKYSGQDVDLLAVEQVPEAFTVEPCPCRAFDGGAGDQGDEVSSVGVGQVVADFQHRPAQTHEIRIGNCLGKPLPVDSGGCISNEVTLVACDPCIGKTFGDAVDEGGRHLDAQRTDLRGRRAVRGDVLGEPRYGSDTLAFSNEEDLPLDGNGREGNAVVGLHVRPACCRTG